MLASELHVAEKPSGDFSRASLWCRRAESFISNTADRRRGSLHLPLQFAELLVLTVTALPLERHRFPQSCQDGAVLLGSRLENMTREGFFFPTVPPTTQQPLTPAASSSSPFRLVPAAL